MTDTSTEFIIEAEIKAAQLAMYRATALYRGYSVEEVDDIYRISRDGELLTTQPSEQAAFDWIDPRADEAVRKRKVPAQPVEPTRTRKPPFIPTASRREGDAS